MNISVHIERLVLDGVPLASEGRPLLQGAVESELARLLADGGLAAGLQAGGATPQVTGANLRLSSNDPVRVGRQIARSVYAGLGR